MKQSRQLKLITCIVPEGVAKATIEALSERFSTVAADFHVARGIGKSSSYAQVGMGQQPEKDMLSVIVQADQADEIFEFLFHETRIDRPHGGIIYINALNQASELKGVQLNP